MQNAYLIGEKVYLRPFEKEDARFAAPWFNDPEVTRTILIYRPVSVKFEEEFLEKLNQSEHDLVLGIAIKATDKLIGGTGFHQIDFRSRHTAFGITIGDKAEWGKGYGTQATRLMVNHAFKSLNLHRVWLHVYEFNERAIRIYESVGFKREGVLRQECFREGRYWNTIVMGILREEWQPGTG
jgi:[ribosomal protein S5]-alanine N-acetyltransferase